MCSTVLEATCRCARKAQDGMVKGVIIQIGRLAVKRDKIAT
jgi:hypothetical protein